MNWDDISTILLSTLGGLNVFQIFFWKLKRRKDTAEVVQAEIDAKQKSIELQQDQYSYLMDTLNKVQKDYYALDEKARQLIIDIQEKCTEIATLKSKITYLKGIACYRTNCDIRILKKDNGGD
jgi:septal ring factor EnvC (AmiA/AmiB activator)